MSEAGLHDYNLNSACVETKGSLLFRGLLIKLHTFLLAQLYHFVKAI
jgi:hypothetical protein